MPNEPFFIEIPNFWTWADNLGRLILGRLWYFRPIYQHPFSHSQIGRYFFSYLLTCEVYLIEVLEITAQMRQYIIILSLKPIKVSSDFILNY
jgi:hypothetical protein